MFSFSLVDVKNINSTIQRSSFSETDLERLAEVILESGGLIKPLVLKATGAESYTVVDGHLEYYAAARAREKDPRRGEMVNAFVISPKSENTISRQSEALRAVELSGKEVRIPFDTTNLESRLVNLELRFEKQINEFRAEQLQERQRVEEKLKQIESQMPKQIAPLDAFNTLKSSELVFRLRTAGLSDTRAAQIAESVESEREKKKFESLSNVVARVKITSGKKQIKGISNDKMIDIVDSWRQLFFS